MANTTYQPPKKKKKHGCLIFLLVLLIIGGLLYAFFKIKPIDTPTQQVGEDAQISGPLEPAQQEDADRLLQASSGETEIYTQGGAILAMTGAVDAGYPNDPTRQVAAYFVQYQQLYQMGDFSRDFILTERRAASDGGEKLEYRQVIEGVAVYGSNLVIKLDAQGQIVFVSGGYLPASQYPTGLVPQLQQAEIIARVIAQGFSVDGGQVPELVVYNPQVLGAAQGETALAWVLYADGGDGHTLLVVSAADAEILLESSQIFTYYYEMVDFKNNPVVDEQEFCRVLQNEAEVVYDSQGGNVEELDAALKTLRNVVEKALYQYESKFNWTLYNDPESKLVIIYDMVYDSPFAAELCDTAIVAFTDANSMKNPEDVFTHELQHRVTRSFVTLNYSTVTPEAGALNEAYSDFFTTLAEEGTDLWQVYWGDDLLRDMADPRNSRNPDHIDRLYTTSFLSKGWWIEDSEEAQDGFPHKNSTIISHAAYLLAEGGQKGGISVEGIGLELTQEIMYASLEYLADNTNFYQARLSAVKACEDLYGTSEEEAQQRCDQVKNAFAAVGIGEPAEPRFPAGTPGGGGGGGSWGGGWESWVNQIVALRQKLMDAILQKLLEQGVAVENYFQRMTEDIINLMLEMLVKLMTAYLNYLMRLFFEAGCGGIWIPTLPVLYWIIARFVRMR